MTEQQPEASPIPEPDTPAPGLPEVEPEAPAEDEPAAEEEPKPDHAERLRGLFSEALTNELVSINDRLDAAGL